MVVGTALCRRPLSLSPNPAQPDWESHTGFLPTQHGHVGNRRRRLLRHQWRHVALLLEPRPPPLTTLCRSNDFSRSPSTNAPPPSFHGPLVVLNAAKNPSRSNRDCVL